MRKLLTVFVAIGLFVVVAAPVTSVAQDSAETTESVDAAADLRARIEQYRTQSDEDLGLNAESKRRIVLACVAAQSKIATAQERANAVVKNRSDAYDALLDRLESLVVQLENSSVDTEQTQAVIVELDSLMTVASAALDQYVLLLSDATEMDCEADPVGFRAALSVARQQRVVAVESAAAVKDYATTEVKVLVQSLRAEIGTNE